MTTPHPPVASEAGRSIAGVPFRNAYDDRADVVSDLLFAGGDTTEPLITIAIPTYRRPALLAETVESVLAQRFNRPIEIVIVDNDPVNPSLAALLERVPALHAANIRYYVNRTNIGVFPNWNRGIQLARGTWISLLNDDDLLSPDFMAVMFREFDRDASLDGIVCSKSLLDERAVPGQLPSRLMLARVRLMMLLKFQGRATRRIQPNKLFWGAVLGNTAGFLFRAATARKVGGFYPEDNPSSDYWFYLRFMLVGRLRQHSARLATIRATESSATPHLVADLLRQGARLQALLPGRLAPAWWRRIHPLMLERHRIEFKEGWGVEVPKNELEAAVGMQLPADNRSKLELIRLAVRGF